MSNRPDEIAAPPGHPAHIDRRGFLHRVAHVLSLGVLFTGGLWAIARGREPAWAPPGARRDLGILRPPGALAEQDFLGACIRCTRCADACSTNAIMLLGPESGALQGTPYIDPIAKACNMCLACGDACPTAALEPLGKMSDVAIGTATVDDRLCVSINGTGICGACFTACPLRGKAITQGIRNAPEVHAEFCTGCGLCEEYCIVDEREGIRAIQVRTDRQWAVV